MASSSKLFQPIKVGNVQLQHRVVLAPLTRVKATQKTHVPHVALVKEHYAQRASTPGTLLIAEATLVSAKAGTYAHVPGLWSQEQTDVWKQITDGVHEKGSFIFGQLWALGRTSDYKAAREEDPSIEYIAPSPVKLTGKEETPRAMTVDEIKEFVQAYANAAFNAVDKAGFDGVEIHGANGYLIDQFIQDVTNKRTDQYGGSVENRARFALEVVDAVVKAVGAEKTGIRFSPWGEFQDMRMEDPKPTFAYLVSQIKEKYPNLAYIHLIEPRVNGSSSRESWPAECRDLATEVADEKGDLIAFGRVFIANPDLPLRLKNDIPLTPYDRAVFYLPGEVNRGYNDYPFATPN
ncbi:NADH:flavin oxidoreductase/NADH oxidase [Hymenopellis radicata]|nr:NADH:flavin oxidoreductase/NADH oxidase [Hymenopellis radicata]